MKPTLSRPALIDSVAKQLSLHSINDKPVIWQAINDTSDAARKNGWTVRDWDQNHLTAAVQRQMMERAQRYPRHACNCLNLWLAGLNLNSRPTMPRGQNRVLRVEYMGTGLVSLTDELGSSALITVSAMVAWVTGLK